MKHPARRVKQAATWLAGLLLAWLLCSRFAVADDDVPIAERRHQQQRTVDAARQLIAGVLDVQLEQFAENGLTDLPVYRDVRQMRQNLSHVSENDMQRILELLGTAEQTSGTRQAAALQQARATARQVVAVLVAQRERLRERLKMAYLPAQLKQLSQLQRSVRAETRRLHDMTADQRDAAALSALEDQRDAHTLYDALLESLQTAGQWDTAAGNAAREGRKQLSDENVSQLFAEAELGLSEGDADEAERHQTEILKQLASVLDAMHAAQQLEPLDQQSLQERIRQMMAAQQQLSEDTEQIESSDVSKLDMLSQRQHDVRERLAELDTSIEGIPDGLTALQQARRAAYEAEEKLFAGAREDALSRQRNVLRKLEQIKTLLESTVPADLRVQAQPSSPDKAPRSRSSTQPTTPTGPADSQSAEPGTLAARRTASDAQRSNDDRAIAPGRSAADAPWFARLPTGLREAIRSRSRAQLPRGYEERLQRYFESAGKYERSDIER